MVEHYILRPPSLPPIGETLPNPTLDKQLNNKHEVPVERTATTGFLTAKTLVTPTVAISPISEGPKRVPLGRIFSPAAMSHPIGRMSCPVCGVFRILISSSMRPSSESLVSSVSST